METLAIPLENHQNKTSATIADIKNNKSSIAKDLDAQAKKEAEILRKEADKIEAKGGKKNKRCARLIRKNLEFFENLPSGYFDKIMAAAYKKCAHKR